MTANGDPTKYLLFPDTAHNREFKKRCKPLLSRFHTVEPSNYVFKKYSKHYFCSYHAKTVI